MGHYNKTRRWCKKAVKMVRRCRWEPEELTANIELFSRPQKRRIRRLMRAQLAERNVLK